MSSTPCITDQRGPASRAVRHIDIGAFESQLALPRATLTVTSPATSGPGSLSAVSQ